MKYRPLLVLFALFVASQAFALPPADPARFEKAVQAFEAADAAKAPPKDVTLFVGASNIRRWESLSKRFSKTPVLNRGFGGSQISDVVHFADRVVIKYHPKQIYLNAGGNDLHAGRTPEEVLAAFEAFATKVRTGLPKTKLAFISIPTAPSRWDEVELVKKTNGLISAYCAKNGVDFINIFPLLLGSDGKPRPELYVEDKLHFSEAGYDIVTSAIRWQKDILAFAEQDAKKVPPTNPIIFTGSSSIRRWSSLADDFPGLPVMNHGFGGSEAFDSFNYADLTVIKYKPKQVVMYAGSNDIAAGKTPERVLTDIKAFVAKVHTALPDCRISYVSNAPNPKRWNLVDKMRELNRLAQEFCKTDKRLEYINTHDAMLGADGKPLPDIFVEDQLHMNQKGYAIWTKVIAPHLLK
ncbi:MAG: GDSL-type esterase/lipase family protein [Verrucomicrobiaceae bacterium]